MNAALTSFAALLIGLLIPLAFMLLGITLILDACN